MMEEAWGLCRKLFCSLAVLDRRVGHTMDVLSPFISVLCHSYSTGSSIRISSTGSPVHVLMLSIQTVRGLPHLRAPGTVPCIISFSLVSSLCDHSMIPLCSSFVKNPLICFLCCPRSPRNLSGSFHLKGVKTCFFILSECPAFTAVRCYRPHSA